MPTICCELCHPDPFADFALPDLQARPKRGRNRATIKDYKSEPRDLQLMDALDDFREQETVKEFGKITLRTTGPSLIMSNEILKRLVDCAHYFKIKNKGDLVHETRWSRAEKYSEKILALIQSHSPPPPPPAPLEGVALTPTTGKPAKGSGLSRCGACGELGHISKSRIHSV